MIGRKGFGFNNHPYRPLRALSDPVEQSLAFGPSDPPVEGGTTYWNPKLKKTLYLIDASTNFTVVDNKEYVFYVIICW